MGKKKRGWKLILILFILAVFFAGVYFTFFFYNVCEDELCFQAKQKQCIKTRYINDETSVTWFYTIKGLKGDDCGILVKVLKIKEGSIENEVLEGKEMDCFLPLSSTDTPSADLSKCHGILKEQIQEMMIRNAHAQIISHLGEIEKEWKNSTFNKTR